MYFYYHRCRRHSHARTFCSSGPRPGNIHQHFLAGRETSSSATKNELTPSVAAGTGSLKPLDLWITFLNQLEQFKVVESLNLHLPSSSANTENSSKPRTLPLKFDFSKHQNPKSFHFRYIRQGGEEWVDMSVVSQDDIWVCWLKTSCMLGHGRCVRLQWTKVKVHDIGPKEQSISLFIAIVGLHGGNGGGTQISVQEILSMCMPCFSSLCAKDSITEIQFFVVLLDCTSCSRTQYTGGQRRNAGQMPPGRGPSDSLTPSGSKMSTMAPAGIVDQAGPGAASKGSMPLGMGLMLSGQPTGQMLRNPSTNSLPGIMSNSSRILAGTAKGNPDEMVHQVTLPRMSTPISIEVYRCSQCYQLKLPSLYNLAQAVGLRTTQFEEDSPELVNRKVKALLNKFTLDIFKSILDPVIVWARLPMPPHPLTTILLNFSKPPLPPT
ncbi:hypothetical protein VP01_515g14 [Puccinia sorghi]|uniref:Uncharacterized protein n=1 Tax=Puccinia sorghi TaxID=27349 RepID=A0A0L6UKY3_9BASI|nr:hypothetical protein VP01_515g14 [Puccinia sorghi]